MVLQTSVKIDLCFLSFFFFLQHLTNPTQSSGGVWGVEETTSATANLVVTMCGLSLVLFFVFFLPVVVNGANISPDS